MSDNFNNPSKREIQKAWDRYLNNSFSHKDLSIIIESLQYEYDFQEFYDASKKEWDFSAGIGQLETDAQRDTYKQQALKLLADYERNTKNSRIRPSHKTIRNRLSYSALKVAAVLIAITLPVIYYLTLPDKNRNFDVEYVEVKVGRGEVEHIQLPDSSNVTLNSNSTLKYPTKFTSSVRDVSLIGEAIFDIRHNEAQPFVVQTSTSAVKVLGTTFDIKAYEEDQYFMVTVLSGKVQVNLDNEQALLERNQQLKVAKATGNFEKLNVDARKYLSWTDGSLYFNRTPIQEVLNMLNRHYPHLDIELAEGVYTNLISGEHDNTSAESILNSISYSTGMKYRKEKNKIVLFQ